MEENQGWIQQLFNQWQSVPGADQRAWVWGMIAAVGGFLVWRYTRAHDSRQGESFFQSREFERKSQSRAPRSAPLLGQKRAETPPKQNANAPLLLTGLKLQGAPHEILGVPVHATKREIQKAFRAQILRYHPDQMPPEQHKEAAKIVDALTRARDALLEKRPH